MALEQLQRLVATVALERSVVVLAAPTTVLVVVRLVRRRSVVARALPLAAATTRAPLVVSLKFLVQFQQTVPLRPWVARLALSRSQARQVVLTTELELVLAHRSPSPRVLAAQD